MLDTKTTNGHSLISPSGASRWANCPGSVRLTMKEESKGNAAAQRGTDIHQVGELMLGGKEFEIGQSCGRDTTYPSFDGAEMFWVDKSILEEAGNYHDYVMAIMDANPEAELHIESKVSIYPDLDVEGHVDACVVSNDALHVIDLKTGRGAVSAENNMQLMLYAIGLDNEHEMFYDYERIVLHIVQDNGAIHNTNKWECTLDELLDFSQWIYERAKSALSGDAPCEPGETQCKWCSHAPKCVALYEEAQKLIANEFESLEEDEPTSVPMEQVITFLEKEGLVTQLFKAYRQRITDELMAGKEVNGYKVVRAIKRKKWINEVEAFNKIKSWTKAAEWDDLMPRKLLTPTQAIKILRPELTARKQTTFDTLFDTPEGELIMAPTSDKRPAVPVKPLFEDEEEF